jgi:cytochrome d ubiquinol oxidase subunit II
MRCFYRGYNSASRFVVSFSLFSVLDGFDLGIGMIVVFLRDRKEAGKLLDKIAPFWDGNELWLIIGVGLIFAFFSAAFAVLLSTLYLPIMQLHFGPRALRSAAPCPSSQ